jgi:predicted phosphohydrolase
MKNKYIWITDTHITTPFNRSKLLNIILEEKAKGVFHTGDISQSGLTALSDLEYIGKRIGRPFYFCLGNHNIWFSSFEKMHRKVRDLCKKYKNLIWMEDADVISLNDDIACVGVDGWYDAMIGDPYYLKYTLDWVLIDEFRSLPNMDARIEMFRELAKRSAKKVIPKLEQAIETHKTVYLLSHVPMWSEANRCNSWLSEQFWTPYNTNYILGQELEKVMEKNKKRYLCCLAGHTHNPVSIQVSRNLECRVGRGSYYKISEDETIYI